MHQRELDPADMVAPTLLDKLDQHRKLLAVIVRPCPLVPVELDSLGTGKTEDVFVDPMFLLFGSRRIRQLLRVGQIGGTEEELKGLGDCFLYTR